MSKVAEVHELLAKPPKAGGCQVLINRIPCIEPGEGIWEGGCVHEHVTTDIEICAEHRAFAERPFDCLLCKDHKCSVQLREVARRG